MVDLTESLTNMGKKQKVVLQFNKFNGVFVAALTGVKVETLNQEHFNYAEDEFNFNEDTVLGKYPDYQIVPLDDVLPRIYEKDLDTQAAEKITKAYTVVKQINILSKVITELCECIKNKPASLVEAMDDLQEMAAYVNRVKRDNNLRKEFYAESNDFDYISIEDEEIAREEFIEGGAQEFYGGRAITGGTVF